MNDSQVVSCAGTVLATWSAAKVYMSIMIAEIKNRSRDCVDQAIHNVIVRKNGLPNVTIRIFPDET